MGGSGYSMAHHLCSWTEKHDV